MKKKPRLGRPPIPKRDRRGEIVLVRMTKAERSYVAYAAKLKGESISEWMRAELIAAADATLDAETQKQTGATT